MTVSAKREARVELQSSAAGMDRGIADARRKLRQFEREQARKAKQAERDAKKARKEILGAGRGLLGGVRDGIGIGVGLGAAGGIAGLVDEVRQYELALTRLQIAADATPASMREFSATIDRASLLTGIHRNEILGAASAYVSLTGDMDTARGATATWAKVAAATGATVSDIATSAAALSQQLGIGPDQFEESFSAIAAAGKAGAIELKNVAGELAEILPQWIQFGNAKGIKGNVQAVRELNAVLQVVRGGAGSASETTTNLQALLTSFMRNADKLRESGVQVFTKDPKTGVKVLRSVMDIVDQIGKSKLGKNPDLLVKALGSVESHKALTQLRERRNVVNDIIASSQDASLIQRDFDTFMASSSSKLERAWNSVKVAIADSLTPERIGQMVSGIEQLTASMPALIKAATGVAHAFGRFVHLIARAKNMLQGDSKLELTDDEAGLVRRFEADQKDGLSRLSPSERAAARQIQQRKREYDKAIGDIMGAEDDFGATDDSIKRAIIAAKSDMGPDRSTTQAGNAGRAYLAARSGEISVPRYKRIEEEVRQMDPWYSSTRRGGSGIDEKKFASAIAAALQRVGIGVKVGAEPLSKAVKNAPSLNTRPGGRQ